jgi:hypothetical protein
MFNRSSTANFQSHAVFALLLSALSGAACSSQSGSGTPSNAAGMSNTGGSASAGASGGGASGSIGSSAGASGFGGSLGGAGTGGASGGSAGASAGSANAGNGGNSGSNGSSALDTDCAATCSAQTALDCTNGPDCQADCVAPGNTVNPNVTCQAEYTAMIHCDAPLQASQWTCSQDAAPVPVPGQCASAVCAYACCVGALVADQDLWSRCMPMCN